MTSIFNTSWEYHRMHVWCKFGDCSPSLWRVIARTSQIALPCLVQIWRLYPKFKMTYRADKPNFLEFWVKMAKMTLNVKVNDPIFNTNWEYPKMHVWCKFGDSSSNLWRVIVRTRLSLRTELWDSLRLKVWNHRSMIGHSSNDISLYPYKWNKTMVAHLLVMSIQ